MKKDAIKEELEFIRQRDKGILRPEAVVEYAKNPKTALHKKFDWDVEKAAYEHWLWQAREIIRVTVTVINDPKSKYTYEVRSYVSMGDDRKKKGGGYRSVDDVMANAELRANMLREAKKELEVFMEKYKMLKELVPVFRAINKLKR